MSEDMVESEDDEHKLNAKQKFAKMAIGTIVGYIATQVAEKGYMMWVAWQNNKAEIEDTPQVD